MLLMVVGLVSIAAGGGGTFASFSAETTNAGNYFATGSLILNDKGNSNTCTSAGDTTNNANTAATNGCDTFFTLPTLTTPRTTLTGVANTSGATTLTFAALTGAAIDAGDTLTITDGLTTETVTTATGADVGATSVTINPGLAHTHAAGVKVTDSSATYYAKLTLTNAGTVDAGDIKYEVPSCSNAAQEGNTTLNGALTSGAVITSLTVHAVTGAFATGDPIVIVEGTQSQTFTASSPVADGDTTININSAKVNFSYADSDAVAGPSFGVVSNLCAGLKLSVVETNSTFAHDGTTNALGCAAGTLDPTNATDGLGCTLNSGTALNNAGLNALQALSLASGGSGNTGTDLTAGASRYFLVAVKLPGTALDNTYQNRKAGFDMTWHIDQA
jgi:hypothetical protein